MIGSLYFGIINKTEMSLITEADEKFATSVFCGQRLTPLVPSRTKSEWREYDAKSREEFHSNLKKVNNGELKVYDGLKLGMCPNTWCHAMIYFEKTTGFNAHAGCYTAKCDQCDKTYSDVYVPKDDPSNKTSSSVSSSDATVQKDTE